MGPERDYLKTGVLVSAAVAIASGMWFAAEWSTGRRKSPRSSDRSAPADVRSRAKQSPDGALSGLSEFVSADLTSGAKPADLLSAIREASAISDPLDSATRLRAILRTLGEGDIPEAIAAARRLPESDVEPVLREIGRRFAAIDVKAALAYAREHPNKLRYSSIDHVMCGFVGYWARRAPDEVIAWADALPRTERSILLGTLVDSLEDSDPRAAAALLGRNSSHDQSDFLTTRLFEKWSSRSSDEATVCALELRGAQRAAALAAIARTFASQDPQKALEWAATLEGSDVRSRACYEIGARWAASNPAEVLRWEGPSSNQPALMRAVRSKALAELVRVDPEGGLAYIRALPPGAERDDLLLDAARSLRDSDPKLAIGLSEELPDSPSRQEEQVEWCKEWASTDPSAALTWLFDNMPPEMVERGLFQARGQIVNSLATWCADAPDEAIEWAARLENGKARDLAAAALVAGMVTVDPERARGMFDQLSSAAQLHAIRPTVTRLASADLDSARSWVVGLPQGEIRTAALFHLGLQFGVKDPDGAKKWVQSFAAGPSRDGVVTGFVAAMSEFDPSTAAEWGATISSASQRSQLLEQIAGRWISRSPAIARQWVQQTPHLTAEQKTRLLAK